VGEEEERVGEAKEGRREEKKGKGRNGRREGKGGEKGSEGIMGERRGWEGVHKLTNRVTLHPSFLRCRRRLDGLFANPNTTHGNQCTKFEVSSLSRARDILGGLNSKHLKWVRDHALFRNSLSSIVWDLPGSTCKPNLKI